MKVRNFSLAAVIGASSGSGICVVLRKHSDSVSSGDIRKEIKFPLFHNVSHMQCPPLTGYKDGAQKGFQDGVSRGLEVTREALTHLTAKGASRDEQ